MRSGFVAQPLAGGAHWPPSKTSPCWPANTGPRRLVSLALSAHLHVGSRHDRGKGHRVLLPLPRQGNLYSRAASLCAQYSTRPLAPHAQRPARSRSSTPAPISSAVRSGRACAVCGGVSLLPARARRSRVAYLERGRAVEIACLAEPGDHHGAAACLGVAAHESRSSMHRRCRLITSRK